MKAERHTFQFGEIVTVFNGAPGGTFVIEGRAFIIKIRNSEDMYEVKFLHRKLGTYLRVVDPNGQEDPEAYLKVLNAPSEGR